MRPITSRWWTAVTPGSFCADTGTLTPTLVRELAAPVIAHWSEQRTQHLAEEILATPPGGLTAVGLPACLAAVGGWSGRNVQAVHGPEDLTLIQVAQILTEALGRPIRAETISEDALRAALRACGFGDKQIEGMAGMSAMMRPDFVPEDKRSIVTTTPTTLAAWAHARLRPLLQAESAA